MSGTRDRLGPFDERSGELVEVRFYAGGGELGDVHHFPTWHCHQIPRRGDLVAVRSGRWKVLHVRRQGPSAVKLILNHTGGVIPGRTSTSGALLSGKSLVRFDLVGDARAARPWVTMNVPQAGEIVELDDGVGLPVGEFFDVVEVCWLDPTEAIVTLGQKRPARVWWSFWRWLFGGARS